MNDSEIQFMLSITFLAHLNDLGNGDDAILISNHRYINIFLIFDLFYYDIAGLVAIILIFKKKRIIQAPQLLFYNGIRQENNCV